MGVELMFSEIGWPAPTEADENAQKDFVARLPLWMAAGAPRFPFCCDVAGHARLTLARSTTARCDTQ